MVESPVNLTATNEYAAGPTASQDEWPFTSQESAASDLLEHAIAQMEREFGVLVASINVGRAGGVTGTTRQSSFLTHRSTPHLTRRRL